ncbi:MAG: molybdopterin-binding protein [Bullifex sp.]
MKYIKTTEAVGHVLVHDMTEIISGVFKGARFRKGHIVTEVDIPVLLAMGKENLYVLESEPGLVHENDAALRLASILDGGGMKRSEIKEGKIEFSALHDGLFTVDSERLVRINSIKDIMAATRKGGVPVKAGDILAGTRVIPLMIDETLLEEAEAIAGDTPLLSVKPYILKSAAVITTGSEVYKGLKQDTFTPVVKAKLAEFGISVIRHVITDDDKGRVTDEIRKACGTGADLIICTGGMSVDPDDNTPGAIKDSGARIVSYGAPVLPGAMFLLAYMSDGRPVIGLPGCVMYAQRTVFDLVLPRIAAGERLKKEDITAYGEGGLCLSCKVCTYPCCPFGK